MYRNMPRRPMGRDAFFWVLRELCAWYRRPYADTLARAQYAEPHHAAQLRDAASPFGLQFRRRSCKPHRIREQSFPLVAWMYPQDHSDEKDKDAIAAVDILLVLEADAERVLVMAQGEKSPKVLALADFARRYRGEIDLVRPAPESAEDADQAIVPRRHFGFAWFVPELLRYRVLWREILLASLVIQLVALAMPLFTQVVIDKVVVHRTESTLWVIAAGMAICTLFSAALTWLRQYLVLHTGNRVDAVLGDAVFQHLLKLPPQYFRHRPTGVIAARMHGVETIREFISGAAVSLLLDFPFLLVFVGVMFYYSITLTLVVLAILTLIVGLSLATAPLFQHRLQEQFQFGARNQAFLTEYVAGMETVKSLQLEPQLGSRYRGFLEQYLQAGFSMRQLSNGYNTAANLLEQMMSLLVLAVGAYTVMRSAEFTIGMLVAFQMFSARLSQPMLRLVGLWQQFQQARLSVARLGDLMDAPAEHYSVTPTRNGRRQGRIDVESLSFRYEPQLPLLYHDLSLQIEAGQSVAIMGPSGSGKSTLARLLQGFHQPESGRIRIDGIDITHLPVNQLRNRFGVVPQETTLFSGTIYENLQLADPEANFERICAACRMAEIHAVIDALPQGYQTVIGERGAGLSGGQKQRIAIARALLRNPDVLIFDEATSALDAATAQQFAMTINKLKGKVTILFITHALPRGLQVDVVMRMGTHGVQLLRQAPAVKEDA